MAPSDVQINDLFKGRPLFLSAVSRAMRIPYTPSEIARWLPKVVNGG